MTTRAEQRRNTEERILAAARELFAGRGFERTTIRAVAAAAGVDPALVMQYFGSKQGLFTNAVRITAGPGFEGDPEQLTEQLLATLGAKIGGLPETSLAMIRSMLTHPEATASARAGLDRQIEHLAAALPGEDAELRAALALSTMLGVTIGHRLLELDALAGASPTRIAELLRPALRELLGAAG